MRFEWDDAKNRSNQAKHGLSFEAAVLVFDDPHQLSVQDRYEGTEDRWQTLGLVGGLVVILVVHTWREQDDVEIVRIISARKATQQERMRYVQNL